MNCACRVIVNEIAHTHTYQVEGLLSKFQVDHLHGDLNDVYDRFFLTTVVQEQHRLRTLYEKSKGKGARRALAKQELVETFEAVVMREAEKMVCQHEQDCLKCNKEVPAVPEGIDGRRGLLD